MQFRRIIRDSFNCILRVFLMSEKSILSFFYNADEMNVKDIDRELYAKNKEKFHLFFFHNFSLNITKNDIFKKLLLNEFQKIEPEMEFDIKKKILRMTKIMENFSYRNFDKIVDIENNKHIENINYRISCILDTFNLFNTLYKDKSIVYLIPIQISVNFIELLEQKNIKYEPLNDYQDLIEYYDIVYWANYFSRYNIEITENIDKFVMKNDNITKVIKISF